MNDNNVWNERSEEEQGGATQSPHFDDPLTLSAESDPLMDDEAVKPSSSVKSSAGKPNFAIMAAAAGIGLAVLAGGGFLVKSKLFPAAPSSGQYERMEIAQAPQQSTPGSVFDQAGSKPADPLTVTAEPSVGASVAVPSLTEASAPSVATSAVLNVPADAVKPSSPVSASTAVNDNAVNLSGAPSQVACAPGVQANRAKSVRAAKVQPKRSLHVATAPKSSSKSVSEGKAHTAVDADLREEVVLPSGLKVQAIYPLSGPDVQAWIRESSGRTTIVRVGEFLAGARVTKISAENGEVYTSAGVLTTYGSR